MHRCSRIDTMQNLLGPPKQARNGTLLPARRNAANILGIPRADGTLPFKVIQSNVMSEFSAKVMRAVHANGDVFVAESPPARDEEPNHASRSRAVKITYRNSIIRLGSR